MTTKDCQLGKNLEFRDFASANGVALTFARRWVTYKAQKCPSGCGETCPPGRDGTKVQLDEVRRRAVNHTLIAAILETNGLNVIAHKTVFAQNRSIYRNTGESSCADPGRAGRKKMSETRSSNRITSRHSLRLRVYTLAAVIVLVPQLLRAQDAGQFEQPPTINTTQLLPESTLSGPGFHVDPQVPTNGAM